jgi:hypothetical protein
VTGAQDRAVAHPKVTIHLNTVVEDVYGDGAGAGEGDGSPLKGARIKNQQVRRPFRLRCGFETLGTLSS